MRKLFYLMCSLLTVAFVSCENSKGPSDPANGHEYVDLGLSVKWATCNVGANSPEEYGNYYAWGETETKAEYSIETYKWSKGKYDTYTKYCILPTEGTVDNKITLELSDDVANANWGGNWRMPNSVELEELLDKCTWRWDEKNGVEGYKVISNTNGNSIFLPAAGLCYDSILESAGFIAFYWSRSLDSGYSNDAYSLYFNSDDVSCSVYDSRYCGLSVRPVLP